MKIKKILMLLAAAGLLGACASDEEAQVTGEPVPIRLSAAVEGSQTRAATTSTTGDTELLDGQDVDAYIKVKGGDWVTTGLSATVPRHFSVTGNSGDLARKSGEAMDYYPMDGTPVSIYAVHPSIASAATFTVKSDQTDDANYAASDLSYSKTADYNRIDNMQTLTFKHLLSKIIVKVQTDLGTVNSVKLRAKKSITLTYPADNDDGCTLGTASGAGMIEMNAGGAAIIPPQTTTAVGDVRIIVEIDGKGTFVYNFPASTTFASNIEYTYTVNIGASITVTSSISAWGYNAAGTLVHADETNNKTVQIGRPKLPIEYVIGTHNMASANTMASDDDVSHCAYFYWGSNPTTPSENTKKFINGTALPGYHLPSKAEWCSIIPPVYGVSTDPEMGNDNVFVFKCGSTDNNRETLGWGVTNNNTSSTWSANNYSYEVYRVFYNDYNCPNDEAHEHIGYALRFKDKVGENYVNGIYTCAFRYEYLPSEASVGTSALSVKVKYVGANANITIAMLNDESDGGFWSTPDFTIVFPACGIVEYDFLDHPAGSFSPSINYIGIAYYWSATRADADANGIYHMCFHGTRLYGNRYYNAGYSTAVRLFKDVGTP